MWEEILLLECIVYESPYSYEGETDEISLINLGHVGIDWWEWEMEQEGLGWLNWGKDGEEEQRKRYLGRGSHYGDSEKADTKEISKNPQ